MDAAFWQLGGIATVAALIWAPWWLDRRRARAALRDEVAETLSLWRDTIQGRRAALTALANDHPRVCADQLASDIQGEAALQAAELRDDMHAFEHALDAAASGIEALSSRAENASVTRLTSAAAIRRAIADSQFAGDEALARGRHLRGATFVSDAHHWFEALARRAASLAEAQRSALRAVRALATALDRAEAGLDALAERGWTSHPANAQVRGFQHELALLGERALVAPEAVIEDVAPALERVGPFADQIEQMNAAAESLDRQLAPRLSDLDERLAALRAEGHAVREPGFEPDVMRRRLQETRERVGRHVAYADGAAAFDEVQRALTDLDALHALVGRWDRWREVASHRIGSQVGRVQELRSWRDAVGRALQLLERHHAETITASLRERFDAVERTLEFGLACLRGAREKSQHNEQRHLAAAELLRRAQSTFDDVRDLFLEIEQKPNQLAAARSAVESAFADAARAVARVDAILGEPGVIVSDETERLHREAGDLYRSIRRDATGVRPDWLHLERRVEQLGLLCDAAASRAEHDASATGDTQASLSALYEEHRRLRVWLDAHRGPDAAADRLAASEARAAIASEIRQARPIVWAEVLHAIADAERLFQEALRLAAEPYEPAMAARDAVARASDAIERADRSYGHRVRADVRDARFALEDATQSLVEQAYDTAEARASRAAGLALRARSDAEARVAAVRDAQARLAIQRTEAEADRAREGARPTPDGILRVTAELAAEPSFGTTTGFTSFGHSASR